MPGSFDPGRQVPEEDKRLRESWQSGPSGTDRSSLQHYR